MKRLITHLVDSANGNSSAFNEVVLQYQDHAFRRAYAFLKDYSLAEDAVQEAFLAAYLNLASLRNFQFFSAWFRAILNSSITKTIKKSALNVPVVELDDSIQVAALAPPELDAFEQHEMTGLLRRAMENLSLRNRMVCTHFYLYGYSQKEIAELFDIPVGTVKRRLHDARRQIRAYLKLNHVTQGIRVGYMPISDHLLAMVSHHTCDNDHLRIELQKFLSWGSLIGAIRNGLLDVAFIMATHAMTLHNQEVPIRYVLDAAHGGSAITVRNSISSPKALMGTRLGLPLANSTHHFLLHYFLNNESLSVGRDVTASYLSPSHSIGAMKKDLIDGFFCAEPWNTKAVHEGVGRILVRSDHIVPGHICCIVIAREDLAADRGDILQLYVDQLRAAAELARKQPGRCSKIQTRYTGIDSGIAEDVLQKGHVTFADLVPTRERIETTMDMALNAGTLEKKCDLDSLISLDFI